MRTTIEAPPGEPSVAPGGQDGRTSGQVGVRLRAVRRAFASGVVALDGVTLAVAPDEVVAIVGPSGCGKSTLLELVCGLQTPDAGEVVADPAVLMPQRDLLLPWMGALDNAALALRARGVSRGEARAAARPLLRRLGLGDFETTRPDRLSGGMRQRVAFVRTLLSGRPLLALDEPFAALDALTRLDAQQWLAGALAAEPRTALLVTHDVEEAILLADRVAVMTARPGRIAAELTVDIERPRRRSDPATVALRERVLEALARGREAGA